MEKGRNWQFTRGNTVNKCVAKKYLILLVLREVQIKRAHESQLFRAPQKEQSLRSRPRGAAPALCWASPPGYGCLRGLPQGTKPTLGQTTVSLLVVSREQRLGSPQKSHPPGAIQQLCKPLDWLGGAKAAGSQCAHGAQSGWPAVLGRGQCRV